MELNCVDNVTNDRGHYPLRRITRTFYFFILTSLLLPQYLLEFLIGSRLPAVVDGLTRFPSNKPQVPLLLLFIIAIIRIITK
jgi:hypothetical protein